MKTRRHIIVLSLPLFIIVFALLLTACLRTNRDTERKRENKASFELAFNAAYQKTMEENSFTLLGRETVVTEDGETKTAQVTMKQRDDVTYVDAPNEKETYYFSRKEGFFKAQKDSKEGWLILLSELRFCRLGRFLRIGSEYDLEDVAKWNFYDYGVREEGNKTILTRDDDLTITVEGGRIVKLEKSKQNAYGSFVAGTGRLNWVVEVDYHTPDITLPDEVAETLSWDIPTFKNKYKDFEFGLISLTLPVSTEQGGGEWTVTELTEDGMTTVESTVWSLTEDEYRSKKQPSGKEVVLTCTEEGYLVTTTEDGQTTEGRIFAEDGVWKTESTDDNGNAAYTELPESMAKYAGDKEVFLAWYAALDQMTFHSAASTYLYELKRYSADGKDGPLSATYYLEGKDGMEIGFAVSDDLLERNYYACLVKKDEIRIASVKKEETKFFTEMVSITQEGEKVLKKKTWEVVR